MQILCLKGSSIGKVVSYIYIFFKSLFMSIFEKKWSAGCDGRWAGTVLGLSAGWLVHIATRCLLIAFVKFGPGYQGLETEGSLVLLTLWCTCLVHFHLALTRSIYTWVVCFLLLCNFVSDIAPFDTPV